MTRLIHSWLSIAHASKSAVAVVPNAVVKSGRITPSLRIIRGTQSLEIGWWTEIKLPLDSAVF